MGRGLVAVRVGSGGRICPNLLNLTLVQVTLIEGLTNAVPGTLCQR